eukprot:Sspe_Gene.49280::Locus_26398_Transcript_1_1_Confidence_1.000_Length_532::g.49280::m.49280/K06170/PSENEN, PEN2; presenilin enhancer 2
MFAGPLTKERAERVAKWQFYGGFFFLPWLWVSNYLYFWDIQKENEVVRKYCRMSLAGFVASCVIAVIYWACMINLHPDSSLWIIHPGTTAPLSLTLIPTTQVVMSSRVG